MGPAFAGPILFKKRELLLGHLVGTCVAGTSRATRYSTSILSSASCTWCKCGTSALGYEWDGLSLATVEAVCTKLEALYELVV